MSFIDGYSIMCLLRRIAVEPMDSFRREVEALQLGNKKTIITFGVKLKNDELEMEGIKFHLPVPKIFIAVHACDLYHFFIFVRTTDITHLEMYLSKTIRKEKLYDHWDYTDLAIYKKCKIRGTYFGYKCNLEEAGEVQFMCKEEETV